jgi:16S rRNA G966 N2-methylase RsmD
LNFPDLNDDAIKFIRENEKADVNALLLKHKSICNLPASFIADQILARRKAKSKLPGLYRDERIIFPPLLNLEQTSSEETANYKAEIISKELGQKKNGVDLTGGFGIDTLFISRMFEQFHFVEVNAPLLDLVKRNHKHLGLNSIIYHNSPAEDFLKDHREEFDLIYIDPSRRVNDKKVYTFKDSSPDVTSLRDDLLRKTNLLVIKAAPLLDIKLSLKELIHVSKVIILSVKNECKELLFLCQKEFNGEPEIVAVNLGSNQPDFIFRYSAEVQINTNVANAQAYLYEPNASIMKAGAFKTVGEQFQLYKLHPNTHLYTSDKIIEGFPGRIFEVQKDIKPTNELAREFPDKKVNVMTRNYPLSPDEIKKKYKLDDGGDNYLIAFTGKEKRMVSAKRVR